MRVLITGMSGTGKSAAVKELRRRGYVAYDADDDGFSEPAADGVWRWRIDAVADLLVTTDTALLFFAGCSDEQTEFVWDRSVLLTSPESVILARLRDRSSNSYGKAQKEQKQVVRDVHEFEPVLRRSADAVIDTTAPLGVVVDRILDVVGPASRTGKSPQPSAS